MSSTTDSALHGSKWIESAWECSSKYDLFGSFSDSPIAAKYEPISSKSKDLMETNSFDFTDLSMSRFDAYLYGKEVVNSDNKESSLYNLSFSNEAGFDKECYSDVSNVIFGHSISKADRRKLFDEVVRLMIFADDNVRDTSLTSDAVEKLEDHILSLSSKYLQLPIPNDKANKVSPSVYALLVGSLYSYAYVQKDESALEEFKKIHLNSYVNSKYAFLTKDRVLHESDLPHWISLFFNINEDLRSCASSLTEALFELFGVEYSSDYLLYLHHFTVKGEVDNKDKVLVDNLISSYFFSGTSCVSDSDEDGSYAALEEDEEKKEKKEEERKEEEKKEEEKKEEEKKEEEKKEEEKKEEEKDEDVELSSDYDASVDHTTTTTTIDATDASVTEKESEDDSEKETVQSDKEEIDEETDEEDNQNNQVAFIHLETNKTDKKDDKKKDKKAGLKSRFASLFKKNKKEEKKDDKKDEKKDEKKQESSKQSATSDHHKDESKKKNHASSFSQVRNRKTTLPQSVMHEYM